MHSEAAEMQAVEDESADGTVLKELQPGYMLKGALLRAARVVVGVFGASGSGASDSTDPNAQSAASPESEQTWETDESPHELEFGEEGLDFSNE